VKKVIRMIKKYTHIFFDLDNTLWDFRKNSRNAMFEAFQHFGLENYSDFDLFFETYSTHNHSLWDNYRKNEVTKKELVRLRFQNTFNDMKIIGVDALEMNDLYLTVMPKQTVLNEGVPEILMYLKKKRYILNIITNGFSEVQHAKIKTSGLIPYFDKIFISEEIKSPKPQREIFEYSIKSSNALKKSSIMVGDDWEVDVLGAVKFGIDAIHYRNNDGDTIDKLENPLKNKCEIFSIGKIDQLVSVL
jgi:putative hydrolase of the HAD superfamily